MFSPFSDDFYDESRKRLTPYTMMRSDEAKTLAGRLQRAWGLESDEYVYGLGIQVLDWMSESVAEGYEVGSLSNEAFGRLLLPPFDAVVWRMYPAVLH